MIKAKYELEFTLSAAYHNVCSPDKESVIKLQKFNSETCLLTHNSCGRHKHSYKQMFQYRRNVLLANAYKNLLISFSEFVF